MHQMIHDVNELFDAAGTLSTNEQIILTTKLMRMVEEDPDCRSILEDNRFRCTRCGTTRTWIRGMDGPTCDRCGSHHPWVRVGSFSELHSFWSRPDVCRIGEHVAEGVKEYRMIPREKLKLLPPGDGAYIAYFTVQACPIHAPELRKGVKGLEHCVLEEPQPDRARWTLSRTTTVLTFMGLIVILLAIWSIILR